ncbi:MAG: hypothetical protein L0Z62_07905, partial [Gemmataceae bacterium]|nr:hypothetical protein [Gemmataceae bacterium]
EMHRLGKQPHPIGALTFSPDGKQLACGTGSLIRRWDVATGKQVPDAGGHQSGVSAVAFSPDGKLVASGGYDSTVRLWDSATGRQKHLLKEGPGAADCVVFRPSGRSLISLALWGGTVWDVPTGAPKQSAATDEQPRPRRVAFSPDGRWLAYGGFNGKVHLCDAATGRFQRLLLEKGDQVSALVFSPDGRILASGGDSGGVEGNRIFLWDVLKGSQLRCLTAHPGGITSLVFFPDGKTLASSSSYDRMIRLWDVATGKQRHELDAGEIRVTGLALSPDGRLLASAGFERTVSLWDCYTGQRIIVLRGHRGSVWCIAFSPDGKRLVSGSHDTTALVWDVDAVLGPEGGQRVPKRRALQAAWEDLARTDPRSAYEAVWVLAAAPKETIPLLAKHLRPAPVLDEGRLPRLIAQLDARTFAAREAASDELEEIGEPILPALRRAQAGHGSAEVRRRAAQIVERLQSPFFAGPRLRSLRAIQVLERVGSDEARQVLKALAKGAPGSPQTREAAAALERLDRAPK